MLLGNGKRFTGEQGFIQPEPYGFREPAIGSHPIALLQPQQIAQLHLLRRQLGFDGTTAHVRLRGRQPGQLLQSS